MCVKRIEIKTLNDFFASLKLNSFSKETRSAIIKNHVKISKIVKETEELIKETSEKLLNENLEEVQKLQASRELLKIASEEEKPNVIQKIINNCKVGLKVEAELNELINDLYNELVDVDLIKFELEDFADECVNAGLDFTLADLDKINVLFN